MSTLARDSGRVTVLKALLLSASVLLALWSIATPPGLLAAVAGTLFATFLAHRLEAARLRILNWVVLGVGIALTGQLVAGLVSAFGSFLPPWFTLMFADALVLGFTCFGFFLALRLCSSRWRAFSVVELALVVFSVAHAFADHRHMRIHHPRFLSDWAWSHGVEPEPVLAVLGVTAMALSALLLLRVSRARRLVAMALLFLGGILVLLLGEPPRLEVPKEDELGVRGNENKDDKDKNKGGGSNKSNKPPEPIAVAVLHDDLPDSDALYFRQAVRSKLVGDRLVEDGSGAFDTDVPTRFPAGSPVQVTLTQAAEFHRRLRTSMYLLVDHAQLFGVGFPEEIAPLSNPNPRRFVAAYDVNSLFLTRPVERMLGRSSMPPEWPEEQRAHYTAIPPDPRYTELSERIVRDVDPRFVGDDIMKALAIKQYLEKEGFYSLEEKTLVGDDPVAQFLFGDLRGYCVHFAHAAVFLLRSQGLPARVAIGYGVQTQQRGAGSAVLIFANEAHAWPELYVDGVGWVTFDIMPEHSDEPPAPHVDQDLESALGELARKDPAGTLEDTAPLVIPWELIGFITVTLAGLALAGAFVVKFWRRLGRGSHRLVYRSVLDVFSDLGQARHPGESRERHAHRLAERAPSFVPLTSAHLRLTLGHDDPESRAQVEALAKATRAELRARTSLLARIGGLFNPVGWWFTR
ncbi:MAG: transglutaminase-like domain-containing protein [Archangium sp.]|nr:transglutaminase-like domain-containing protein [Archangium sp.]